MTHTTTARLAGPETTSRTVTDIPSYTTSLTYSVSYRHSGSSRLGSHGDLTWEQLRAAARNVNRLGERVCDIQAIDSRGRDVTFEVPEFLVAAATGDAR